MTNTDIDKFIEKELESIDKLKTVTLDVNDGSLENFNKALTICQEKINVFIKKDGKLLDILKKINNNKLSKKLANQHIKKLSNSIKASIDPSLSKKLNLNLLINNRINQLLKIAIYYALK